MVQGHAPDHSRDPCPYNIASDVGTGFAMGGIGGTFWHGFKGYRNSPRGERMIGAISSIKARAPVVAGSFAVWTGLFNTCECVLVGIRQKEDPMNSIMSGAATGAILAVRSGPVGIALSALVGGAILGVMEGINILITKANADSYKPVAPVLPGQPPKKDPPPPSPEVQSEQKPSTSLTSFLKSRFQTQTQPQAA